MMPKLNYLFLVAAVLLGAVASTALVKAQTKAPEGEVKAAAGVSSATDAAARLTAAEAFVKKYPKSTLRPEVAQGVATEIGKVADAGQRLSLAERYLKTFSDDAPAERMRGLVIDEYVRADRADDAFALGSALLAKQPENVSMLATLAMVGTEAAKKQNTKHVAQTLQYGMKAIALIEADKKPATTDDAAWAYQKSLLPTLYLDMGALSLAGGNTAEARPRLEKAIQLNPADPSGYVFLGGLIDDEYRVAAESYQAAKEGSEKQAALKKATDLMDKVIDLYAHALGAAADKPQYKAMYDTVLELVTPYYRYRYKSTTGLQPLIDKYKTPAQP
jgi:tetratricopeptide (TPR) repeat protein